jgi:hypothetical protein
MIGIALLGAGRSLSSNGRAIELKTNCEVTWT